MEILLAIVAFFVFFLCMATGVILKGQPLKGSCGGVAKLMGNENCEICGGNPNLCEEENQPVAPKKDLSYDATTKN